MNAPSITPVSTASAFRVLVYFHPAVWSQTRYLRGIAGCGLSQGWSIRVGHVETFVRDLHDEGMRFDGVLACTPDASDAALLRRLAPHGVGISCPQREWCSVTVDADDRAIGEAAAAHFLERGFRHIALVADQFALEYGDTRADAFHRALERRGVTARTYGYPPGRARWVATGGLVSWLREGGLPVAVFGVDDLVAAQALRECVSAGLRVPQEVAVLGAENLDEISLTTTPALSSVDVPMEQIGLQAARALQSLMEGREPVARSVLVAPTSVITRASTDALAVSDALLNRAYAFLRQHLARGVSVADLELHLQTGRRQIERRMAQAWGCSPMEMILRMRVAEAKHLLAHSELSMDEVAQAAGFSGARTLLRQFKLQVGLTPAAFRAQHTQDPPGTGVDG